jgi:hypothetical protein
LRGVKTAEAEDTMMVSFNVLSTIHFHDILDSAFSPFWRLTFLSSATEK